MAKRKTRRETVTLNNWNYIKLKELHNEVLEWIDKYGEDAEFEVEYDDWYGTSASVLYNRPETDEEREKRLKEAKQKREREKKRKEKQEEETRALYERLKKKYETDNG